jgi:hypothetical protein
MTMQLKNDQDNSFLLVQSIKNLETATNISNFLLEKNEELQEKLLSYIIKSEKVTDQLRMIESYISEEYNTDKFMKNMISRSINCLEDKDLLKDAIQIKELIKTVSKISSGIKEFKGDPDLWYSLKDQLVSIKIC